MSSSSIENMSISDSESSVSWDYIDSLVLQSGDAIRTKTRFLGETSYNIAQYKIDIGLSVIRGFTPSVRVTNSEQKSISLTDLDWYEFMNIVQEFHTDYTDAIEEIIECEYFTVTVIIFRGEKTFQLSSYDISLCFSSEDIQELLRLYSLLSHRLELFKKLEFKHYYNDFLEYIYCIMNPEDKFIDVVQNYCNLNINDFTYLLLELIEYNNHKLYIDFDKISIYNN